MLRLGVTGFLSSRARVPLPEVSRSDFSAACHAVARSANRTVVDARPRSVTPNFHLGLLGGTDGPVAVLCNGTHPIVGFAEPPVEFGRLRFVAEPALAAAFAVLGYECPPYDELVRPLTEADLTDLDPAEIEQIRYWLPHRVGDVLYNWFD